MRFNSAPCSQHDYILLEFILNSNFPLGPSVTHYYIWWQLGTGDWYHQCPKYWQKVNITYEFASQMVTWEYQFYPIKKGTYNNNFSILTTNKLYSTRHYYNILKKLSIFDRKGKQNYIYTYRISVLNLIKRLENSFS